MAKGYTFDAVDAIGVSYQPEEGSKGSTGSITVEEDIQEFTLAVYATASKSLQATSSSHCLWLSPRMILMPLLKQQN